MKPKGMGGQAYGMMGGQDPKKKKTKMVDLVARDKSGKPIPNVVGGSGLFGYIGGGGLKAASKIFKAFSNAPKQYIGKGGSNIKSAIKQIKSTKVAQALGNTPKQLAAKATGHKTVKSGGKIYGYEKGGKITNSFKGLFNKSTKSVPVVGKPGKTVKVPKSSKTKQVSYVNPRISMTAAERAKAGY